MADDPVTYELAEPIEVAERYFDRAAQDAFIEAIRNGVPTIQLACQGLRVSASQVYGWLALGRAKHAVERGHLEARRFLLRYEAARAEALSVANTTLNRHAREDWRAAEALARSIEGQRMRQFKRKSAKAEAELREQQARIARIEADLLERRLKVVAGRLVFPQEVWDTSSVEERKALENIMARRGLIRVDEPAVAEEVAQRDPEESSELEDLARRWGILPDAG